MRATVHLGESPRSWAAALEGLVQSNMELIHAEGLPSLYEIPGLEFREESGEEWRNALEVARDRYGDCEDIAAYRAAELRLQGIRARVGIVQTGPRKYHAVVVLPDGSIEDPAEYIRQRQRRKRAMAQIQYELGKCGPVDVAILGAPATTAAGNPAMAWWYGYGQNPQAALQAAIQTMAMTPKSTMALPMGMIPGLPGYMPAQTMAQGIPGLIPMAYPQQQQQLAQLLAFMMQQKGMMPGMVPGMMPGMVPGMMPGMVPGMMPGMMDPQAMLSQMLAQGGTKMMMSGDPASMAAGAAMMLLSDPKIQHSIASGTKKAGKAIAHTTKKAWREVKSWF